jgi:hypothetical protein
MLDYKNEAEMFANQVIGQFINRTEIEGRKGNKDFKNAQMSSTMRGNTLWFTIKVSDDAYHITVPIPFSKNNVTFIEANEVKRAVCNHFEVASNREINYFEAIRRIFIGSPMGLVLTNGKKSSHLQELAWAIINNNLSIKIYALQKAVNEFVNKMPLHETYMNSYIMNQRLIFIDPAFDELSNPNDKLEYQVAKNKSFHHLGWTSIGLSDGTLADKNYILKCDLRAFTPFGQHHHNPQRNLYSTLGMKGDELPMITSTSGQELIDLGIQRRGWNLFTAYVDLPDTFEDQILVDKSHANKYTEKTRRIQCYGDIIVKEGQSLKFGQPLAKGPNGEVEFYKVKADKSYVSRIVTTKTSVGNIEVVVHNIIVVYRRYFKDATKFTNQHGNKGVIRMMDLGYAVDPATGKPRKIDVIVSAKTIKKRKNFGQVLEILHNNISERSAVKPITTEHKDHWSNIAIGASMHSCELNTKRIDKRVTVGTTFTDQWSNIAVGTSMHGAVRRHRKVSEIKSEIKPLVIPDNHKVDENGMKLLKDNLEKYGIPRDGTWECDVSSVEGVKGEIVNHNKGIKVKAVCGPMFWGVIKDPEDQLWDNAATVRTNGKDLRTAGIKFGPVEFRALQTRFGADNPITDEILSYVQGIDGVSELIKILRSKKYEFENNKPIISFNDVKTVNQERGTIFREEAITGTICDENYFKNGFILELPVTYQTAVAYKDSEHYEGRVTLTPDTIDPNVHKNVYNTNRIYVPEGILRRPWRHGAGMYGLSELSVILNNIVIFSKEFIATTNDPEVNSRTANILYRHICSYFNRIASILSTKRGEVATYGMSVRYPFSAKAVATLSNILPENTVEIHRDMAEIIGVHSGDYIIVERFPCLGFMGVRPQKVTVTDDPMCKYTIRASGNSLVSLNLDYDGDVLYVAAFHTPEAKMALEKEWNEPNKECWEMIHKLNTRKGSPSINEMTLDDFEISSFEDLTEEEHAIIVRKLTGVKAQTGPVIALAYNLMRILENSGLNIDKKTEVGIEMFIEKAGQSVFEQKHGGNSLCDVVLLAICTGDSQMLINEGFDANITNLICEVIKRKASSYGIHDLKGYHEKVGKTGSNIINRIVRTEHRIYFASRAVMEGCKLLECLEAPAVDLPSSIFKLTTSGKYDNCRTILDQKSDEKLLERLNDPKYKSACEAMFTLFNHAA